MQQSKLKAGMYLLAAAIGINAGAAEIAATAIKQTVGTKNGRVSALTKEGEGSFVSLYTSGRGSLNAQFTFSQANAKGLTLQAVLKQNTAADKFIFEVLDSGTWKAVGQSAGGTGFKKISLSLPDSAAADGSVSVRMVATNSDDLSLDQLILVSGSPSAPTPAPVPPVVVNPAPMPPVIVPPVVVAPVPVPVPPVTNPPATGIRLPPNGKISWDWQIGASGDNAIVAPAGVKLLDVDVFSTSAAKVAQLKAQGVYTVCYINAGSYQPGLPDSAQYPAYLKLQKDPDWAGEYFLDVTDVFKANSALASILKARLQLCKDKGFDAVEPDNLQNDENIKGGLISTQQQIDFNGWFADTAHAYGLAVFQKNGPDKILLKDRTGKMMVDKFDGILNEECQQYDECQPLNEYVKRGKLALNVEYAVAPNCSLSNMLNINTIRKDLNLTGGNMSGYKRLTCP